MHIACWVTKATGTHPGYVIFIAFPLQQWMHEHASLLRYTYIACHVLSNQKKTVGCRVPGSLKTLPELS
jgi:hypothetical protein